MSEDDRLTREGAKGLILDSSALYCGKDLPTEHELIISPGVALELERHGMKERLELLLATRIKVLSPDKTALAKVMEVSRKSGDSRRLSATDKEILALALDLGYELVTDDYSVQNVASILRIPCRGLDQRGISRVIVWESRCVGCGKRFPAETEECDICGSSTKTTIKKSQKRSAAK
ncbi:MAG: nucleic acid-binding protein [Thermoplasmata archaeon]|nr:nucleic acid-binding protein [Thermoplasmata archaeon]